MKVFLVLLVALLQLLQVQGDCKTEQIGSLTITDVVDAQGDVGFDSLSVTLPSVVQSSASLFDVDVVYDDTTNDATIDVSITFDSSLFKFKTATGLVKRVEKAITISAADVLEALSTGAASGNSPFLLLNSVLLAGFGYMFAVNKSNKLMLFMMVVLMLSTAYAVCEIKVMATVTVPTSLQITQVGDTWTVKYVPTRTPTNEGDTWGPTKSPSLSPSTVPTKSPSTSPTDAPVERDPLEVIVDENCPDEKEECLFDADCAAMFHGMLDKIQPNWETANIYFLDLMFCAEKAHVEDFPDEFGEEQVILYGLLAGACSAQTVACTALDTCRENVLRYFFTGFREGERPGLGVNIEEEADLYSCLVANFDRGDGSGSGDGSGDGSGIDPETLAVLQGACKPAYDSCLADVVCAVELPPLLQSGPQRGFGSYSSEVLDLMHCFFEYQAGGPDVPAQMALLFQYTNTVCEAEFGACQEQHSCKANFLEWVILDEADTDPSLDSPVEIAFYTCLISAFGGGEGSGSGSGSGFAENALILEILQTTCSPEFAACNEDPECEAAFNELLTDREAEPDLSTAPLLMLDTVYCVFRQQAALGESDASIEYAIKVVEDICGPQKLACFVADECRLNFLRIFIGFEGAPEGYLPTSQEEADLLICVGDNLTGGSGSGGGSGMGPPPGLTLNEQAATILDGACNAEQQACGNEITGQCLTELNAILGTNEIPDLTSVSAAMVDLSICIAANGGVDGLQPGAVGTFVLLEGTCGTPKDACLAEQFCTVEFTAWIQNNDISSSRSQEFDMVLGCIQANIEITP